MRIIKILGIIIGAFVLIAGGIAGWLLFPRAPMAIDEMVPPQAEFDPMIYDESAATGHPDILILGSTHLVQDDASYAEADLEQIAQHLLDYQPDLVAVEYLGPDYPPGSGRDYRTEFDFDTLREDWELDDDEIKQVISDHRSGEVRADSCALAQAYFLERDYMNGLYHWQGNDCPAMERHEQLHDWKEHMSAHEGPRWGFPAARASELDEIVSFDYQGDDAEWFIHGKLLQAIDQRDWRMAWQLRDLVPRISKIGRSNHAHYGGFGDDIIGYLQHFNSPRHLAYQYWVYEIKYPEIRLDGDHIGARQTENYWLRNRRMFEILDQAVTATDAERVLVIVGGGHKYFLDELAREAEYRWIDPRDYLPGDQA